MDFLKVGIAQSSTYEMKMKLDVEYWEIIVAFVKIVILSKFNSLEGFWPLNNWRSNYAKASLSTMMDVIDPENPIQIPYYGPKT